MEHVLNAFLLIIWLMIMGHVIFLYRAWNHLQIYHSETWEALGKPSVYNINPAVVFPAKKFLWSNERRALKDKKLDSFCLWSKWLGFSGGLLFIAFSLFILGIAIFH